MPHEGVCDMLFGGDGTDVLGLHFLDDLNEVGSPTFDEGEEGSVCGWAVGAGEGEVVRHAAEGEREVRGHVGMCGPLGAHVGVVD